MENWIQKEINRLKGLGYFLILQPDQLEAIQGELHAGSRAEVFIQYDRPTVEALNRLFAQHNQVPPSHEVEKIARAFLPAFQVRTENLDLENNDRGIFIDFINQRI